MPILQGRQPYCMGAQRRPACLSLDDSSWLLAPLGCVLLLCPSIDAYRHTDPPYYAHTSNLGAELRWNNQLMNALGGKITTNGQIMETEVKHRYAVYWRKQNAVHHPRCRCRALVTGNCLLY